jgi:hypothetical protein
MWHGGADYRVSREKKTIIEAVAGTGRKFSPRIFFSQP